MTYKFWETINGKIILMVVVTTIFTLAGVGYVANKQVESGFDNFIDNQEKEFGVLQYGKGKFLNELARLKRHEEMTGEYKRTVSKAIIISSVLGLSFSIVAGTIISSHITDPLRQFKRAIKEVSKNNYKIRAKEIGFRGD